MKKTLLVALTALFSISVAYASPLVIDLNKIVPKKSLKTDCSVHNFKLVFVNYLQGGARVDQVSATLNLVAGDESYFVDFPLQTVDASYGNEIAYITGNSACISSIKFSLKSAHTTGGNVIDPTLKPTLGCDISEAPARAGTATKAVSQWSTSNYICY